MAVPAVNIEIEQGADFTSTFTITNSDGSVFNMSSASAVAKAKKDYNEDNVIDTADDLLIEPGDDFGFTETSTFFGDAKDFAPNRGVDI